MIQQAILFFVIIKISLFETVINSTQPFIAEILIFNAFSLKSSIGMCLLHLLFYCSFKVYCKIFGIFLVDILSWCPKSSIFEYKSGLIRQILKFHLQTMIRSNFQNMRHKSFFFLNRFDRLVLIRICIGSRFLGFGCLTYRFIHAMHYMICMINPKIF